MSANSPLYDTANQVKQLKPTTMEFTAIQIAYEPKEWFGITLLNIEFKDQSRSFLHIERNNGLWKFQFLWLANNCWHW